MTIHNAFMGLIFGDDFTPQISGKLRHPVAEGSFGEVYRCTVESSIGEMEVAVKVFRINHSRDMDNFARAVLRELKVCHRLKHPNIVPLLGTARVESPLPALVSRWVPSGTLSEYLEKQATTTSPPARGDLVKGIAEGLDYLHANNVIHGDFHPGNILIDDSGSPCIADFGLATVVGEPELQLGTTTAGSTFNSRWRAPEVLGIHGDPQRPTFKTDIYSFGSVLYFILSGDMPWKGRSPPQIIIELSREATPPRPQNIFDYHWNLIRECWSWEPEDRPMVPRVLKVLAELQETSIFGHQADTKQRHPQINVAGDIANMRPTDRATRGLPVGAEYRQETLPYALTRARQPPPRTGVHLEASYPTPHPSAEMNANCTSYCASDVTDVLVGGTCRQESHQLRSSLCMVDTETNASNHPTRCPSTTKPETEGPVSPYECVPHGTHERSQPSSAGVLGPRLQITPSIPRSFSRSAPVRSLSQGQVDRPFNTTPPHSPSTDSSLSVSGPLNVLIFGETGVGKSSVINLIMRQNVAPTSPDAQTYTLKHTPYKITLDGQEYKFWEISSITPLSFFRRLFIRWKLKREYEKLRNEDGVYLLLYCMKRGRAQGTLVEDYKLFTSIVGSSAGGVPKIVAVVTFLEDYPGDMDDWWKKNKKNLAENGMRFSSHVCITSLPDDQHASSALRARRWRSEVIIRQLFCNAYQGSQTSVNSVPIRSA